MSILEYWRARHPIEPSSRFRVVVLILLLVMVIIFILNSDRIARGFTSFFTVGPTGAETSE
jgi:uncharacterized membrane protein